MPIRCPYCSHEMALKGARPGKFHPHCPECQEKFQLLVPDDPSIPPSVNKAADASHETLTPAVAHALGIEGAVTQRIPQTPVAPVAPPPPAPSQMQTVKPQAAVGLASPAQDVPASVGETQAIPDERPLAGRLGGYDVLQKLGQGGMGAVYLARQISLDRHVALKVLTPSLASDPQFVARFTREAYAAAQLTHHNIVAIHDIGAERDVHYFSMEFVEGQNLGDAVREAGKLDPESSAGYVLQAAHGLKFAHDHGMIHRDIKPENLLLNDQGIVKVADLGLVKRSGTDETQITGVAHGSGSNDSTQMNMSMGTPAYMAPEQAVDAAHVDQRADIYSLGCTLYDLLTGRPPFMGRSAIEVITKHQREQITPPEMIVRNVPRTLSAILLKMVAKKPDERYQTMNDVIRAMEDFLGVSATGPFTPKEEHVKVLEFAVERLQHQRLERAAKAVDHGVFLCLRGGHRAAGVAGASEMGGGGSRVRCAYDPRLSDHPGNHAGNAPVQEIPPADLRQRHCRLADVDRDRRAVGGAAGGGRLALAVAGRLGAAVVVALGFHFSVDLMLSKDRNTPLTQTEAMLKQMRCAAGRDGAAAVRLPLQWKGLGRILRGAVWIRSQAAGAADVGQRRAQARAKEARRVARRDHPLDRISPAPPPRSARSQASAKSRSQSARGQGNLRNDRQKAGQTERRAGGRHAAKLKQLAARRARKRSRPMRLSPRKSRPPSESSSPTGSGTPPNQKTPRRRKPRTMNSSASTSPGSSADSARRWISC